MRTRRRRLESAFPRIDSESVLLDHRFGFQRGGRTFTVQGFERIKSLILQVLLTSPGERIQEPEFGCGLLDMVFEPLNDVMLATTRYRIRNGLARWLGDLVRVSDIEVGESIVGDMSCLEVSIRYSLVERPDDSQLLALRLRREEA